MKTYSIRYALPFAARRYFTARIIAKSSARAGEVLQQQLRGLGLIEFPQVVGCVISELQEV